MSSLSTEFAYVCPGVPLDSPLEGHMHSLWDLALITTWLSQEIIYFVFFFAYVR